MQKQIRSAIDKEVDKIVSQIKKELPYKLTQIKQEIFGSFQVVISTEVQKVFLETYGPNYDVNSLNNSLTYFIGNDLRPDFSYDKNQFVFNSTMKKNERKFNQNARQQTKFSEFMNTPDFESVEQEDLYWDDNPFDSAFNSIYNSIDDEVVFSPHNKMTRQGGFSSLVQTYEKARTAGLQAFENYYTTILKPRILKKYGIKIN